MYTAVEHLTINRTIHLEDPEYYQLSGFILNQFGIKLPPNKKILLQCRLQKRLKMLNFNTFTQYVEYLFSAKGLQEEVPNLINSVSTNKTDFFREPIHFDFLQKKGLDEYQQRTGNSRLSVWSAGCSSGEEPYSIAMVLKEYAQDNHLSDFNILATDISDNVLQHAMIGVYCEEKTDMIPFSYKKKYLLKGKNAYENKVKINSDLRSKIEFRNFNLLTTDYSPLGKFDIIFCRNVLIYFERELQHRLLKQFCNSLNTGGYLFLGHSESLAGYSLPLKHIQPTIFMKISKLC